MYPLVGFASQAQRYVSKEQRVLSDAPSGQFSEPLARRLPKIFGMSFLGIPLEDLTVTGGPPLRPVRTVLPVFP